MQIFCLLESICNSLLALHRNCKSASNEQSTRNRRSKQEMNENSSPKEGTFEARFIATTKLEIRFAIKSRLFVVAFVACSSVARLTFALFFPQFWARVCVEFISLSASLLTLSWKPRAAQNQQPPPKQASNKRHFFASTREIGLQRVEFSLFGAMQFIAVQFNNKCNFNQFAKSKIDNSKT